MGKILLSVTVVLAVFCLSKALPGLPGPQPGCPPAACPKIRYPDSCRAESWRIINGQLCRHCDKYIPQDVQMNNGCPLLAMPCLPEHTPDQCRARSYLLWNGRMCPDCDVDTCPPDTPMSA